MVRATQIAFIVSILFVRPVCTDVSAADRPPNFVIVLADDQGWGDLSVHGNTNLTTPNIDSLARDGAMLDRFFVCPVCSPTRAEFLTGRYHPRCGVYSTSTGGERLDLDEETIAEVFKSAGYATGAFGKWHNGMQYPYHPNARGFDEYYGFCSGHWGQYFNPVLEHNGELVRGNGFVIDDFTDHALQFIEQHQDEPFFCYLPFNTPHSPMQVPDRFWDKFKDAPLAMRHRDRQLEEVPKTRAALAMCENIDWNVGRLLNKLEELDLAEQTVVIYFSDNGPNSWRWNGGMRGRKGSTDEGGVRVPCFFRWKGNIKPGAKISEIASAIDLLPTLADLADINVDVAKPLDGTSIKPLLTGSASNWPDRILYSFWRGKLSVRTQRYRLDEKGNLYDLTKDPGQTQNVADTQPATVAKLTKAAEDYQREVLPELPREDDRPFPVGFPQFRTTHLPARDGVAHGKIQRSGRAPNCSYFTNWTSAEDKITWDVRVANAGVYEAIIYYTCAESNLGSTIELSFQESRIAGRITVAHDPPEVGASDDRVPRRESYVKEFQPMSLGTFSLQPGRGELTLHATEIPGKQVADIRYVVLRLTD